MIHAPLGLTVAAVSLLNVPFGYWRAAVRRLSPAWFAAVHVPVVLAILLRVGVGLPWRLATLPLFIGAFVAGQALGGALHNARRRSSSRD